MFEVCYDTGEIHFESFNVTGMSSFKKFNKKFMENSYLGSVV